jgi:hypothetical protein
LWNILASHYVRRKRLVEQSEILIFRKGKPRLNDEVGQGKEIMLDLVFNENVRL